MKKALDDKCQGEVRSGASGNVCKFLDPQRTTAIPFNFLFMPALSNNVLDASVAGRKLWNSFDNNPEWYSESTKAWFLEKGYRVFNPEPSDFGVIVDEDSHFSGDHDDSPKETLQLKEFPYPFSHHSKDLNLMYFPMRCYPMGPVGFAQDSQLRIVALKYIKDGSEEYKCLRFVHSLQLSQTQDACILPVLDLLPCDDHWFAVMPLWSKFKPENNCEKVRDALDLMHHMLKVGLYSYFGVSIKFPEDYTPEQCRLPYWESWLGTDFMPDTWQGEFDFDPFAYDVGIMGRMFAESFQQLTPLAPMLAPLLDKMISRNVRSLFTASQALQFFEDMYTELTEEQLLAPINMRVQIENYEEYDRWAGLPADFVKTWAAYREPPVPRLTKIIRAICMFHPWIVCSVAWVRNIFQI
ncbi:hypothetical protein BDQ17DRAFT_1420683 [Cyathus striatus]|nr:hypothetical protein BDQ17DRAFT_1420683 [Cyathus striatus]